MGDDGHHLATGAPDIGAPSLGEIPRQPEKPEGWLTPDPLLQRVLQFRALELPGQPASMHLGTLYLVNDLWREIERLRGAGHAP